MFGLRGGIRINNVDKLWPIMWLLKGLLASRRAPLLPMDSFSHETSTWRLFIALTQKWLQYSHKIYLKQDNQSAKRRWKSNRMQTCVLIIDQLQWNIIIKIDLSQSHAKHTFRFRWGRKWFKHSVPSFPSANKESAIPPLPHYWNHLRTNENSSKVSLCWNSHLINLICIRISKYNTIFQPTFFCQRRLTAVADDKWLGGLLFTIGRQT